MGSGKWDDHAYRASYNATSASAKKRGIAYGAAAFAYSTDTKSKPISAWKVHEDLDPNSIKGFRESRDSNEHPESVAVGVLFDVTGSMGSIPQVFQEKLPKLMTMLTTKAGLDHPQVLFGGIGDAHCDQVPFQVGQFESDNRCDEQLKKMFLEGGGGGQIKESYDLALYFAGYKTALDCFEKRSKKGYLFTLGDETFYPSVSPSIIAKVFGDTVQSNLKFEDLLEEAQKRFEYFHIHVQEGSYRDRSEVINPWKKVLGERFLMLEDQTLVCELISSTISLLEGTEWKDAASGLGIDATAVATVETALSKIIKGSSMKIQKGEGTLPTSGKGSMTRI